MAYETFEFISASDWCSEINDANTLINSKKSWARVFEPSTVQLNKLESEKFNSSKEIDIFIHSISTGGLAIDEFLDKPLIISGSIICHLNNVYVDSESLLIFVNKNLAITECYGDRRWAEFQLNTWPEPHNYFPAKINLGSQITLDKLIKLRRHNSTKVRITEPCFYLTMRSSDQNLFHWIYEVLPRLKGLELLNNSQGISLLTHLPLTDFQRQTLSLMGICNKIVCTNNQPAQIDTLIYTSIPSPPSLHKEALIWVRKMILSNLPLRYSKKLRLFVSRKDANSRRIANELEIMALLKPLGFRFIVMSDYSSLEQIQLFHEAEVIIFAHGAAGANLLFADLKCIVIELHSWGWPNSAYYTVCQSLGISYSYLFGEENSNINLDYSINIDRLSSLLYSLIDRPIETNENIHKVHYYLIHGLDKKRAPFMREQFKKNEIDNDDVTWILKPNIGDVIPNDVCSNPSLTQGQIAVTYKHYLALKDIVENKYSFAVIMEDNISFNSNVPKKILEYLKDLPDDWGCLFDGDIFDYHYIEDNVQPNISTYLKSNEVTQQCGGASRGANFILINQKTARLLYENFLPFDNVTDHYYNSLFRRLNVHVYWSEPPNVHKINRASSWTNASIKNPWWKFF